MRGRLLALRPGNNAHFGGPALGQLQGASEGADLVVRDRGGNAADDPNAGLPEGAGRFRPGFEPYSHAAGHEARRIASQFKFGATSPSQNEHYYLVAALAVMMAGFSATASFGQDYHSSVKILDRQFDGRVKMAAAPLLWLPLVWPKGCPPEKDLPADSGGAVVDVPQEIVSDDVEVSTTARYIDDAIRRIHETYPNDVTDQYLRDAAIRGMLKSLDPYSDLIAPSLQEQNNAYYENRSGYSGVGIGFAVKTEGKYPVVDYTMPDSPAFAAGIRFGDVVIAVNGIDVKNMSLEEMVKLIIGPEGSFVTLKLLKNGLTQAPMESVLVRKVFTIPNIYSEMATADIAYIDMRGFHSKLDQEFKQALEELSQNGMKRLIVDLRGNPGGYIDPAINMAKLFLAKDQVVITAKYRDPKKDLHKVAGKDGDFMRLPVAILIDGHSASASEMFAGALWDHGRALLVGSQSFGKGIIQGVRPGVPENGYSFKMTEARYYFASGKTVGYPKEGENGLLPDIKIDVDPKVQEKINHDRLLRMMRQPLDKPTPDETLRAAVRYFYAQASR